MLSLQFPDTYAPIPCLVALFSLRSVQFACIQSILLQSCYSVCQLELRGKLRPNSHSYHGSRLVLRNGSGDMRHRAWSSRTGPQLSQAPLVACKTARLLFPHPEEPI